MRLSQFNLNCRAAHTSLCCLYDDLIVLPLERLCLTFCFLDLDSEARQRLKNVSAVSIASVSALTGVRKFPKSAVTSLKLSFFPLALAYVRVSIYIWRLIGYAE